MQAQVSFYPVKIVSRAVVNRRFKRASWLVLGTSLGMSCLLSAAHIMGTSAFPSGRPLNPAYVASTTAVTKGIDVIAFSLPPVVPAHKPAPTYPLSLALKAEDGDTLMSLLTDAGTSYEEARNVVDSMRAIYNPKRLDVGQKVSVVLDKPADNSTTPVIASVVIPASATSTIEITRKAGQAHSFEAKKIIEPVERRLAHAGGRIDSSLYETAVSTGIPTGLLSDVITAYSYDVDFQRDIQPGDSVDILYERPETKQGMAAGRGDILYAELTLSGYAIRIYRYVDKSGTVDYYNQYGESLRKAMLRTPINGATITSGYGMRNHPILGYSKMHRGVDFGAPTGTPIYAAGDGTVEFAGRKGGYGNYLKIKHGDKYASAYGHISRFASNVSPGRKVKQGQIVAYVGATGMATGPHLHYEILVNNEQINPANIKFKAGNSLAGKELAAFHKNMNQIEAQRASTPRKTDVAKLSSKKLLVAEANQ